MEGLNLLSTFILCCLLLEVTEASSTFYCKENRKSEIITENEGTIITLYDGDTYYRNNQHCVWVIDASGGDPASQARIQITVESSSLQWTPENAICNGYDYIEIRNGGSPNSPVQYSWCGDRNPEQLTSISEGPKVYISFDTNDRNPYENTYRGIKLKFDVFTMSASSGSCPPGWKEFKSMCYLVSDYKGTWVEAYEFCRNQHANLVMFSDYATGDYITELVKSLHDSTQRKDVYYWLGLSDIAFEGSYEWIDKTKPKNLELKWQDTPHVSEPYNDCIAMRDSDGKWQEQFCTESEVRTFVRNKFICERSMERETEVYDLPEESEQDEGEGKIGVGRRWIIAGIILGCVLIAAIVLCCCGYRRYGDDIKARLGRNKRREPPASDTEATPMATPSAPPVHPQEPPPPYNEAVYTTKS